MSYSYSGKCGGCRNLDLNEKSLGKFYCRAKRVYYLATETSSGCRDYDEDRYRSDSEIDKARERIW